MPCLRTNGQGTQDSLFSCEITTDNAHPTDRMDLRSGSYKFGYMTDNPQQWFSNSSESAIVDFDKETKTIKAHMHFLIPLPDANDEEEEDSDDFLPVQLAASTEDWRNPITTYNEKGVQKFTEAERIILQANNALIFGGLPYQRQIIHALECLMQINNGRPCYHSI